MQQDTPRSAQQFIKITDYTSVLKCSILFDISLEAVITFTLRKPPNSYEIGIQVFKTQRT